MGKSYFEDAEEAQGGLRKSLTGALVEIVSFERSKTGEKAQTPGCLMYILDVKIVEPKKYAGITVREWITIGTADDLPGKRPETWKRTEGGPGRLVRILRRSGTPLTDEDEEWMEAAEGKQYVTPIRVTGPDENGNYRGRLGLAYRPTDDDCPEIGEASGEAATPRAGKAKLAAVVKKTKVREVVAEDEEDEKPAPKAKRTSDDEDEAPVKRTAKPADDDDDEDDD